MRKIFIIVLWALLLIGMLATYIIFSAISDGKIGYVPPIEELENPNLKFATQVISDDGKVLGTWSLSKENRLYVGYEDLSPNLVHALVALWLQRMCVSVNIQVSMPGLSCVP